MATYGKALITERASEPVRLFVYRAAALHGLWRDRPSSQLLAAGAVFLMSRTGGICRILLSASGCGTGAGAVDILHLLRADGFLLWSDAHRASGEENEDRAL